VLGLFSGQEETGVDDQALTVLHAACTRAGVVIEGRRVFAGMVPFNSFVR
jgi:hypothetical protein